MFCAEIRLSRKHDPTNLNDAPDLLDANEVPANCRHGRVIFWSAEGVKIACGDFHRNYRHGKWRFWNADGTGLASGKFYLGQRHGIWIEWRNGKPTQIRRSSRS